MKGWSALANFALDDLAVTSAHQRLTSKSREYAEHAEEARLREVDAKRKIAARKRADATERMQRFRAREREEKIANGWVAGQKRKCVELVDVDETVSATDITMVELSCPKATKLRETSSKKRKYSEDSDEGEGERLNRIKKSVMARMTAEEKAEHKRKMERERKARTRLVKAEKEGKELKKQN
ncbi:hypothetical protein B0H10DRAFT_2223946 [Mycena sp. CBHHK59/15]|nr:hypothetical protein B0H10DRAFT_2223946 [Mycena sp. CBHHK59/15]